MGNPALSRTVYRNQLRIQSEDFYPLQLREGSFAPPIKRSMLGPLRGSR
jgi:hypothetical protein